MKNGYWRALALTVIGLTDTASAAAPNYGGAAVLVIGQDPTNFNPALSTGLVDRTIGCVTSSSLLQVTPDYQLKPLLAKSWAVSPDGLTYTFELNKAEWHDGKPFTSEDVKFSLLEINAKYSSSFIAAGRTIEAVETPAPDKVVVKLKQTFGPFFLSLTCSGGGTISPAHIYRGTNPLQNPSSITAPVGTGAFKFAEWVRSDHIRLVKNDKFFIPGRPYLDEIIAKVIPQTAARMQALKAGEVDIVQYLPPNDQTQVRASANLKIERNPTAPGMTYAFLNNERKPLDDKRVRQALFMAVDREYLLKNAFFGLGEAARAPFTTDIPWAVNKDIDLNKLFPFDVARANALLDEAGVKRGADGKRFALKIAIFATTYPEFQQVAAALKSMWAAVGIDLSTESLEDATMLKKVYADRDFDVTLNSYSSFGDPALGISRVYVSSMVGRPLGNPTGYKNAEIDKLFDEGEKGTTNAERVPAYSKIQAMMAQELPSLPLRQYTNIDGASKRLNGLWGDIQGSSTWIDAWLEK